MNTPVNNRKSICGRISFGTRQHGFTLIEMLVASLLTILLGLGVWTLLRSYYDSQYELLGQNTATAQSRTGIDTLADNLRGANGLTSAAAHDITYTNASSQSIRYWLNSGSLVKSVNGAPAAGTVIAPSASTLNFVYWTYSGGVWSSSTAPAAPTNVGALDFTVVSTSGGSSRQVSGSVRIRMK